MTGTVHVREMTAPPVNRAEILRYMQAQSDPQTEDLITVCLQEAETVLQYRICYAEYPVRLRPDGVDAGFAVFPSRDLAKNLRDCPRTLVFAATVGEGIDRLIRRYQYISPSKALCFSAIGSERVEAICAEFCREKALSAPLRPRFSPGYGDLALEWQHALFRALDCPRRIGLTLTESCLMSPTKSVTAFVGKEL